MPGLATVRFLEVTGGTTVHEFAKGSSQLANRLADPLGPNNNDFVGLSNEYYDVFYSKADGTPDLDGNCITVEASFLSGGGLNIDEVYLVSTGGSELCACAVTSAVYLGDSALPGSAANAADCTPGTWSRMGTSTLNQRLRITVRYCGNFCVQPPCPAWSATIGTPGFDGDVRALVVLDLDGLGLEFPELFAGGDFTTAGSGPAQHVASWDGSSWTGWGPASGPGALDGTVHDLALYHGDLYVAGSFTSPSTGIAKWSAGSSSWVPVAGGLDGPGYALEVYQGSLFVGGDFDLAGGFPAHHIASFDGSAWSSVGPGLDLPVLALALGPDFGSASLYAGGEFDRPWGGTPGTLRRVARWNGTSWGALGSGMNGTVRTFVSHDNQLTAINPTSFYAGGDFTTAGGQTCNHVAGLAGLNTWEPVGDGLDFGTDGSVHALASFDPCGLDGPLLIAAGSFATAGTSAASCIARFDNTLWLPLGSGTEGTVRALASFDDGNGLALVAGGAFEAAGGQAAGRVATRVPCSDCCGGKRRPRFLDASWGSTSTVAVRTAFRPHAPADPAVELIDLSSRASAPLGPPGWTPPAHTQFDWTIDRLGELFGVALDDAGNIYAAHSSVFGHPSVLHDALGSSGLRGVVYKLGSLLPYPQELAILPNFPDPSFPASMHSESYPGLGDLAWDCGHHRLFVSNFEDGIVYALVPETGEVVDRFDHAAPDDGSPGFAPLGERVFGLATHEHRLYYGVMTHHWPGGAPPQEIWSVALGVEGRFHPWTARLEIQLASTGAPAGLAFGPGGSLFVATLMTYGDSFVGPGGDLEEYRLQGGFWVPTVSSFTPGLGTFGGVDCEWEAAPEDRVWTTASLEHSSGVDVDGLLGLPPTGGGAADGIWVDADGDPGFFGRFAVDVVVSCPPVPGFMPVPPGIQLFCLAGQSGVIACPCANPPSTVGAGCDNSLGTGGAVLSASGAPIDDTIVFSSANELATALSIFLQGTVDNGAGVPFGDGVRCIAGVLKRLYVKAATAGTATAPAGSDLSVLEQSSVLGDAIQPGSTRYYQVYYRDPNLSFCPQPAGSTFNASNGVSIVW